MDSSPQGILAGDPQVFRHNFDRQPYKFAHRLSGHPLFTRERLIELAREMSRRPGDVYFDAGDVGVGQRWDTVPMTAFSAAELLERVEQAGAWIVLRRAERFPEYAALLDQCMAELEARSGRDFSRVMRLKTAIVFINSPRRVTSYHIDREVNWLLQIEGEKTVHVFDRSDRAVLPEDELERFWTVDNNAPVYRPEYEDRALEFVLRPGEGLHIPVESPHWLRTGDRAAVSLGVNFHYLEHYRANVYRANYALRRLGLQPTPPGQSAFRDALKRAVVGPALVVRRQFRGGTLM